MKLLLTPVTLSLALALSACNQAEVRPSPAPVTPAAPEAVTSTSTAAVTANPGRVAAPAAAPLAASPSDAKPIAQEPAPSRSPTLEQPATAADASAEGMEVRRLILASRVIEREPEVALAPRVGEPLLAFVEVKNAARDEERIIVTFEHESGTKVGFVRLAVPGGAERWRTWARTHNLKEAGNWTAVVRSEAGQLLGRTAFTLSEG